MTSQAEQPLRSHDALYATVSPQSPPKESFVCVADVIENSSLDLAPNRTPVVVDIGAASGAFVKYLLERLSEWEVKGIELRPDLVESAEQLFGIHLTQGSILDQDTLAEASADAITLLGVVGIFDDLAPIARNVSRWIRPGGLVILHGMFNPFDIDVFVRYREVGNEVSHSLESGWNVFSHRTVSDLFTANGASSVGFFPFEMPYDLEPSPGDPVRSWTEVLASGERQIVNGLWLKQPQYIVVVSY